MVSLAHLWLPIVVAAVLVFVASSLVHMVFKWHNKDYLKLPNEDEVRAAIQKGNPAPGQYVTPWAMDQKDCNTPEMKKKFTDGPVGALYLKQPGPMNMVPMLGQWFVYLLVVSFFVAYVGAHALPAGTVYLRVFQLTGATAFIGYGLGTIPGAIWMGKPWAVTIKEIVDGLLYALVTAGSFGAFWPKM